jgi:prepilin-type processing-associated H-X9-DG protein
LADGGTDIGLLSTNNQDLNLRNLITAKDIYFQGNDGGSTITALTLDMSQSGQATFGGNLVVNGPDVTITGGIIHAGDTNTYFGFHDADQWRVVTGGTERIEVTNTEIVINDSSVDMDFRVESNGNANMLFVDGGSEQVKIGASSMATYGNLEVQNSDGRHGIGQKSWSAISGTSHPSRSVDGVMAFNTASAGNQLSIPIVSQANQHRPALIELTFLSGEYNTSGSVKAGFVRLAFQSLNSIGSVAEIDKSGNVASVSSSGMNILINFTSAYTAGQSNYEGVMCYYRVMHEQPQYVKMWDATLN